MNNFAIFITTHERSQSQLSLSALRNGGYTGKIYLIIDNEDRQINDYKKYINENTEILIFDKKKIASVSDCFISFNLNDIPKAVLFARIACEDFAKKLKLKYFMVMDDDIKKLSYRICTKNNKLSEINMFNFNEVCEAYCNYLEDAKIAMLGCGNETSYFGGIKCFESDCQRRCFNIFFRNVSIDFSWISAMNEDYISSIQNGKIGKIIFELKIIKLIAEVANKNNHGNIIGGMAEYYKKTTDYERSFYAVIANPSCSYVTLSQKNKMIITSKWNNAIPKIISDKYKK